MRLLCDRAFSILHYPPVKYSSFTVCLVTFFTWYVLLVLHLPNCHLFYIYVSCIMIAIILSYMCGTGPYVLSPLIYKNGICVCECACVRVWMHMSLIYISINTDMCWCRVGCRSQSWELTKSWGLPLLSQRSGPAASGWHWVRQYLDGMLCVIESQIMAVTHRSFIFILFFGVSWYILYSDWWWIWCACATQRAYWHCIINAIAIVRETVNVELEEVWTEVVCHSVPDVLVSPFA